MLKLFVLLALLLPWPLQADTAAEPDQPPAAEVAPPRTNEEALERLERFFGSYDSNHPKLTVVEVTRGDTYTPLKRTDEAKAGVVTGEKKRAYMVHDLMTYGTPLVIGETIAVDSLHFRRSWEYEVGKPQEPERTAMRHGAIRYRFRKLASGQWSIETETLAHSNPTYTEGSTGRGTVIWYKDGFRLATTVMEALPTEDGEWFDAILFATRDFREVDGALQVWGKYRYFESIESPDGDPLQDPDFSKPLSKEFAIHYPSLSRDVGKMPEQPVVEKSEKPMG